MKTSRRPLAPMSLVKQAVTQVAAFEAVILDMDGLVLDTEPGYWQAWQRAALEMGLHLSDEFCLKLSGRHADDVRGELKPILGTSAALEQFQTLSAQYWRAQVQERGIAVKAGLLALLDWLKCRHIPFGLATNSDRAHAMLCLSLARIDREFPVVISRDQVAMGKPAPDVFLEAARRLQVQPSRCLAVDDSATGIVAASRAGTIPILVCKQSRSQDEATQLAFAVYPSLIELVKQIEPQDPSRKPALRRCKLRTQRT